jgi:hypothetical protein
MRVLRLFNLSLVLAAACSRPAPRGTLDSSSNRQAANPTIDSASGLTADSAGGLAGTQDPANDTDLAAAGIRYDLTRDSVALVLGRPDSVLSSSVWYPKIVVYFSEGRVDQFHIIAPGLATARGLQVGDPDSLLTRLYGPSALSTGYLFERNNEDPDGFGISVDVVDHRVRRIIVGHVVDVD